MPEFPLLNLFCILHDALLQGFVRINIISRVTRCVAFLEARLLQISQLRVWTHPPFSSRCDNASHLGGTTIDKFTATEWLRNTVPLLIRLTPNPITLWISTGVGTFISLLHSFKAGSWMQVVALEWTLPIRYAIVVPPPWWFFSILEPKIFFNNQLNPLKGSTAMSFGGGVRFALLLCGVYTVLNGVSIRIHGTEKETWVQDLYSSG